MATTVTVEAAAPATPPALTAVGAPGSADPLAGLTKLTPITYLSTPAAGPPAPAEPSLIILSTWMNAAPRPIAKYLTQYQARYPRTPILLLRSSTGSFFFNTAARRARELGPALSVLRAHFPADADADADAADAADDPAKPPRLLAHSFSNGGSGQLALLAEQYQRATGAPLPVGALVMDSAVGYARFGTGMRAFSVGLPRLLLVRWLLKSVIAVGLFFMYILPTWLGFKTMDREMGDKLNTVDGTHALFRAEASRAYIYSDADQMIDEADVESHAGEAAAKGVRVIREKWEGSAHVMHMMKDPDRYWEIVRATWERRG